MSRVKAGLRPAPGADYRNDPPKVIVTGSPAILLLLDGEPRLQEVGSSGLQKVVNTAFPVIFDPRTRQYWLYGSTVWFTTRDLLHGAWAAAASAPANIADLVRDTHTLDSEQADAGKRATPAQLRTATIFVATEPTELIVTEGAPHYSPLVGGEILYVTNTDSDIFMEVTTQRHFLVISGRWFAGPSLQGPWSFIAPEDLPRAFAEIPDDSPKADDLAFVAGTARAKDALLDSVIPQTAEVSRRDASIDVQYDGAPKFSPIPNTSLDYAENTASQVIRSGGRYYACEEGVWYVAPSPSGPWSVSDARPAGIDALPPSSPVYNTKFVYVFDATPDFVRAGYLPGYRWSLPYHGVIVYGTGWRYRGWYGRYYYPRPATWGFCVRYTPWLGWSYGMSWNAGWLGLTSSWGWGWAGWTPAYGPSYRPGFWSGYYAGGWFGPGGYRPPRPPGWHPPGRPAPASVRHGGDPAAAFTIDPAGQAFARAPPVRPPVRPPSRPSAGPGPRPSRPPAQSTQPDRPSGGGGRSGTAPTRPPVQPTRPDRSGAGRGRPEAVPARPPAQPSRPDRPATGAETGPSTPPVQPPPASDDSGRGRGRPGAGPPPGRREARPNRPAGANPEGRGARPQGKPARPGGEPPHD